MTELKCPICNTNLEVLVGGANAVLGCPRCRDKATNGVWQELIRTRKELEQSETCCTEWEKQALDYKAENIGLSGELERTRKALDVAVEKAKALKELADIAGFGMFSAGCQDIIEQITALE